MKKYPNYVDYQLFNLLGGSNPPLEKMPLFDFPDDDSVEKFIKENF